MAETNIRVITPADIPAAVPLLESLNPEIPASVVRERLETILADHPHYELFGAFTGDQLAGLAGAWIATKIWCGRYLEVDNLVVSEDHRSSGIGSLLVKHLEELAKERDCKVMVLDSYASNTASHRLYYRLGFEIWGFHFVKPIGDWKGHQP